MPAPRLRLSRLLLAACLTAGCTAALPSGTPKPGKGTKVGTAVENPLVPPGTDTPSVVSNGGGGIISDQAASLSGTITAPAGIISSNGAGIISGNTGNYRVLSALAQAPLAGATVQVVDASGTAVKGADGKALTAQTDAQGHYRFTGMLPSRNLIVQVDLGAKGTLQAVVPKDTAHDKVDADLISTLTTRYILDQYVATQTDKLATFDRLPGAVEADTRAKALTAFSGGTAAVPDALTHEAVLATVTSLRASDKAFDGQMAYVRSLLIIGQSDLGNGRPASEVDFGVMRSVVVLPNGDIAVSCPEQSRVWRITPQGIVFTIAGSGTNDLGSIDGKAGPDAGLYLPGQLMVDADGHLIILENTVANNGQTSVHEGTMMSFSRVTRVEADGKLTELWPNVKPANIAVPMPSGELWVFTAHQEGDDSPVELWAVARDKTRTLKHTFTRDESALFHNRIQYGLDASGHIHFTSGEIDAASGVSGYAHYQLDPTSFALSRVGPPPRTTYPGGLGNYGAPMVGAQGETFHLEGDVFGDEPIRLLVDHPGGATNVELSHAIPETDPYLVAGWLTGEKTGYLLFSDALYKVDNGELKTIAGFSPGGTEAADTTFNNPKGVAMRADGGIFVVDNDQVRLVDAGGKVSFYAGDGTWNFAPGPAAETGLNEPTMIGVDTPGNLYVLELGAQGIRIVDAHQVARSLFQAPDGQFINQMAVGRDGRVFFAMSPPEQTTYAIFATEPGGTFDGTGQPKLVTTLDNSQGQLQADGYALAADAAGSLYLATAGKLQKWTAAAGLKDLATGDAWHNGFKPCSGMAADGRGRVYLADSAGNAVRRFDPATSTWDVAAGPGGKALNGTTVDESLSSPVDPAIGPTGDLLVSDPGHKQVKRVPADKL